jgi:hypothetical protein
MSMLDCFACGLSFKLMEAQAASDRRCARLGAWPASSIWFDAGRFSLFV